MKTFSAKLHSVKRNWYIIDATNKTLGRLATRVVCFLRGKHKVEYTPHIDTGDYIIIVNAKKVILTGNKSKKKLYYRHTGYVGGIKSVTFEQMMDKHPERVIRLAVKGMLPRGILGRSVLKKMLVYASSEHNHSAQKPSILHV